MKLLSKIILSISLIINFIYLYHFYYESNKVEPIDLVLGSKVENIEWEHGVQIFRSEIKSKFPKLSQKKYFYINIWSTWCRPCVKEMPWLDSIAFISRKDIGFCFVTSLPDTSINEFFQRKNLAFKEFISLNGMDKFISSICYKLGRTTVVYPMNIVINSKNEIVHFSTGAYGNAEDALGFHKILEGLK